MNLDDELRDALRAHAGGAPAGTDLLDQVRQRAQRYDARRTVLVVLAAAVAVVLAVAVPVALRPAAHQRPAPAASAAPSPSAAEAAPVTFVPANYRPPAFPYTPGWVPAGLGTGMVSQTGPLLMLAYSTGAWVAVSTGRGTGAGGR